MQFEGDALAAILAQQVEAVDIHDQNCYSRGAIPAALALRMVESDIYFGVGNRRRIRYLRPCTKSGRDWCGGSQTTRRMKDTAGVIFSAPLIREHKPIF